MQTKRGGSNEVCVQGHMGEKTSREAETQTASIDSSEQVKDAVTLITNLEKDLSQIKDDYTLLKIISEEREKKSVTEVNFLQEMIKQMETKCGEIESIL